VHVYLHMHYVSVYAFFMLHAITGIHIISVCMIGLPQCSQRSWWNYIRWTIAHNGRIRPIKIVLICSVLIYRTNHVNFCNWTQIDWLTNFSITFNPLRIREDGSAYFFIMAKICTFQADSGALFPLPLETRWPSKYNYHFN